MKKVFYLILSSFFVSTYFLAYSISSIDKQETVEFLSIAKAKELFNQINRSPHFSYFDHDAPGANISSNSEYWDVSVNSERSPILYIKNTTQAPSAALDKLISCGGKLECETVLDLVTQKIAHFFLEQAFDTYHLYRQSYIYGLTQQVLDQYYVLPNQNRCGFIELPSRIPSKPGEFGYIPNIDDYKTIFTTGISRGENVFCIGFNAEGKPLYLGFGVFFSIPRTLEEIENNLYSQTITAEGNPQNLSLQAIYKASRETWNIKQKKAKGAAYRFDLKLLKKISRNPKTLEG